MPYGFSSGRLETGPGPFLYTRVVEIRQEETFFETIKPKSVRRMEVK